MPSRVLFSADQAGAALWTYGEDALVERARSMSEPDLRRAWRIAGASFRVGHTLPLEGRLVLDKVIAFACIEVLEGAVRPLARERRRPKTRMPAELRDAKPVAGIPD